MEWLKISPNLTKLALTKMPKGRGCKGCTAPPRKKKKVAVKSRKSFAQLLKEHCTTMDGEELSSDHSSGEETCMPERLQQMTSCGASVALGPERTSLSSGDVMSGIGEDRYRMYDCRVSLQGGAVEFSHSKSGTKLNVSGGRQERRGLPLLPPPLVHSPSSPESQFELAFIAGNISVCRGCRQKYTKPTTPPFDLCIRHKEWQEFLGPLGTPQTRYGNVYYHCNVPCVKSRNPEFQPARLHVHPSIAMQLMPVHTEYLSTHARKILMLVLLYITMSCME